MNERQIKIFNALKELLSKYESSKKEFKQNIPAIEDMIKEIERMDNNPGQDEIDSTVKEFINKIVEFKTNSTKKILDLRNFIDEINPKKGDQDLYNIIYNALQKLKLGKVKSDFSTTRISKDGQKSNKEKIQEILDFIEKFKDYLGEEVCKIHIAKLLLSLNTSSTSTKATIIQELVGKFSLPAEVTKEMEKEIQETKSTQILKKGEFPPEVPNKAEYTQDWTREIQKSLQEEVKNPTTHVYVNGEEMETFSAFEKKLEKSLAECRLNKELIDRLVPYIMQTFKGVDLMSEGDGTNLPSQLNFNHNMRCYFQFNEKTGDVFFKREFNGYRGKPRCEEKDKVYGKFVSDVIFNIHADPMLMKIDSRFFVNPELSKKSKAKPKK